MQTDELIATQAKAGKRYAAAVAELQEAFVDLAAIDGALANANSGWPHAVPTFGPVWPQNLGVFAHPIFAPIDPARCWTEEFKAARDALVNHFNA
jgi:hypothetical protein